MARPKVLIVGGGAIGRAVWSGLIHSTFQPEVKVIDANPDHFWKDMDWFEHVDDFFVTPHKYLRDVDYLVMAVPNYDPVDVVALLHDCYQYGVNYIDFSEDVHIRAEIQQQFQGMNGIMIAPGCGLAPGMVQVLSQWLAEPFDEVVTIEACVGSLPLAASNFLMYHPMWSVEGVINEYTNPVTVIEEGRTLVRNPLEWDQTTEVNFEGAQYEAFETSGGFGTMTTTWDGKADHVSYRTLRYPGHLAGVKGLLDIMDDSLFMRTKDDYNLDALREQLEVSVPLGPLKDRVLIHLQVRGIVNGVARSNVWSRDIRQSRDINVNSAIQRTTAAGAIAVMSAHHEGDIKGGLVCQEEQYKAILQQTAALAFGGYV